MRHSRTPFLTRTEVLFEFAHFRSLQMAELRRPAVDAGGDERQSCAEFRMTTALNDLRRYRIWFQLQSPTNDLLDLRVQMSVGSDCSTQFAHGDRRARTLQTSFCPAELVIHKSHFQTEGNRFGMDSVTSSDHWCQLMSDVLPSSSRAHRSNSRGDPLAGPAQYTLQPGITNITHTHAHT